MARSPGGDHDVTVTSRSGITFSVTRLDRLAPSVRHTTRRILSPLRINGELESSTTMTVLRIQLRTNCHS